MRRSFRTLNNSFIWNRNGDHIGKIVRTCPHCYSQYVIAHLPADCVFMREVRRQISVDVPPGGDGIVRSDLEWFIEQNRVFFDVLLDKKICWLKTFLAEGQVPPDQLGSGLHEWELPFRQWTLSGLSVLQRFWRWWVCRIYRQDLCSADGSEQRARMERIFRRLSLTGELDAAGEYVEQTRVYSFPVILCGGLFVAALLSDAFHHAVSGTIFVVAGTLVLFAYLMMCLSGGGNFIFRTLMVRDVVSRTRSGTPPFSA